MKNKIFLVLLCFICSFSCATMNQHNKDSVSVKKASIEDIPFGISQEDLIKTLGEPNRKAFDQKTNTTVFSYTQNYQGTDLPKETFVFGDKTEGLKLKYMNVRVPDPESSLDFWKAKYPNLLVKSKQIVSKHFIEYEQYAELDSHQSLSIRNNHVVTIYWSNEK